MVLVTGASGFLGGELVKQLIAKGESVRIIKRATSDISHLQNILDKINVVEGDILDVSFLEDAFEGIEKIYHVAAVVGYDSTYYDAMYKCNIEGTANVVNIALDKGIKKLLYVSSIAAIGGKPDEWITEETKWEKTKWTAHYGITKMLAEREVWRGMQEGLEAVIVNPGIIVGYSQNDNKATMRLFQRIANGKMPVYTNGTNGFVSVEDVADICIQLMNSKTHSERFIVVGENISFKTYFEQIAKQLQVAPPKKALNKKIDSAFTKNPLVDYELGYTTPIAAEPETEYLSKTEIEKRIREKRKAMEKAAKDLDFMQAAKLRDEIKALQNKIT